MINIESNGTIIVFLNPPPKRRLVNGSLKDWDLMDPISLFARPKGKVNSIVEPYAQKMPVRLFNYISILILFFSCYSLSLSFVRSYEIEEPFIMLYHQGNDPPTC